MKNKLSETQITELLCQALETERGGIQIYERAVCAVQNEELRAEFSHYLKQTRQHEAILTELFTKIGLDTETSTPGREVVALLGKSLAQAIDQATANAGPVGAELVACECVVLAETKDHANWELIGKVAEADTGERARLLKDAYEQIEKEEDHHLYHSKGWCRESWLQSLGLPAVLPPPEEVKQVETAIGAARAEQARDSMH